MLNGLTTADVLEAFSNEIAVHQGTVADTYQDGSRLIARAVLPRNHDVQPNDRLQAGVAIKASEHLVCLHPYVFRLVCKNGAIMAQAEQSREIADFYLKAPDESISELRQAVRVCCEREAFTDTVEQISAARHSDANLVLTLLPMLSRLPEAMRTGVLRDIMDRFFGDEDRSTFGLMNAVTSVARDTADPEARWNLEELGGAIPIAASGLKPRPRRPVGVRREREVLV